MVCALGQIHGHFGFKLHVNDAKLVSSVQDCAKAWRTLTSLEIYGNNAHSTVGFTMELGSR